MANQLYQESLQNNMSSQFGAFMQNPMGFLMNCNINIPQNLQNNPKEAVQYLLNNGKMSQESLNRFTQMANKMGINLH